VSHGDSVEGTVEVLVAMYEHRAEPQYYLETDSFEHVRVHFEMSPGILQPGERLALAGRWTKGLDEKSPSEATFTATAVLKHLGVPQDQAAGGSTSGTGIPTAARTGLRTPLLHRVAVIMLGTSDYTVAEARAQVNQTTGSGGSFLTANSDGIDAFEGDVFGPYNVNTSDCANRAYQIADLAKAAAAADGKSLSAYSNLAFLLPRGVDVRLGWPRTGGITGQHASVHDLV